MSGLMWRVSRGKMLRAQEHPFLTGEIKGAAGLSYNFCKALIAKAARVSSIRANEATLGYSRRHFPLQY
jgi:hypothetical protein